MFDFDIFAQIFLLDLFALFLDFLFVGEQIDLGAHFLLLGLLLQVVRHLDGVLIFLVEVGLVSCNCHGCLAAGLVGLGLWGW